MYEGYEGADLLKLAYCYGTRSQKERKTLEIKEVRRVNYIMASCYHGHKRSHIMATNAATSRPVYWWVMHAYIPNVVLTFAGLKIH